ncbi:MAG: hypothetical protein ACTSWD_04725 [Candidatus Heimdallarchaeota archaeon]
MATGNVITNNGQLIMLNRTFKSSPDYSAPSVFKIGIGTTTPLIADTDVETGVNIDGGATKSFVSGYPILDEANLQATIRCLLDTTEGNGNSLTEFGLFNSDGTPKMFSHAVYTAITKTNKVLISFVEKDKF